MYTFCFQSLLIQPQRAQGYVCSCTSCGGRLSQSVLQVACTKRTSTEQGQQVCLVVSVSAGDVGSVVREGTWREGARGQKSGKDLRPTETGSCVRKRQGDVGSS